MFQYLFHDFSGDPGWETLSLIMHNKGATGFTQRLLWYCQLPGKNFGHISRNIWHFSLYFKTVAYLFNDFSRNRGKTKMALSDTQTTVKHSGF
jgi:hypothetical protein